MDFNPNPPPPAPPVIREKRGPGCFVIGLIVVAAVIVIIGVIGTVIAFVGFTSFKTLTSTAPVATHNIDAGDQVYHAAELKGEQVESSQGGQGATVEYTADELNTLIARDPDFEKLQIHLNVGMEGDRATLEVSMPTSMIPIPVGGLKDRFINARVNFGLGFDSTSKQLKIDLHEVKIGPNEISKDQLPMVQSQFEPVLNQQLRGSPEVKSVLDRARNIEVKDGKLVIETE